VKDSDGQAHVLFGEWNAEQKTGFKAPLDELFAPLHLALQWDGERAVLFVNGRPASDRWGKTGDIETNEFIAGILKRPLGQQMTLGAAGPRGHNPRLGAIYAYRLSRMARYPQSFVPGRLMRDDDTEILYDFADGSGTTVHDAGRFGYDGTIFGATWVDLKGQPLNVVANRALQFDGTDDHVVVDSLVLDDIDLNQPLTIEASVRTTTPSTSNMVTWLGDHWLGLFYASGKWGAGRLGAAAPFFSSSTNAAAVDRWVKLASVWDGTRWNLYVDGVRQPLAPIGFVPVPTKGGLYIGGVPVDKLAGHNGDGRWFTGEIDEVRLSTIARYKDETYSTVERFTHDVDTLALYHFDEGQGTTLKDSSGNKNHGTIEGATWTSIDGSTLPEPVGKGIPLPAKAPFNADAASRHQQAWAEHLRLPVEYTNSIGMKFALIPPGEFIMGSKPEQIESAVSAVRPDEFWQNAIRSELPPHTVVITQPFYLGIHEVTQMQYEQVMQKNPSLFASTGSNPELVERVKNMDTATFPVDNVSWSRAVDFCSQLSVLEHLRPYYDGTSDDPPASTRNGYRLPTEAQWERACRAGTTTLYSSGDDETSLRTVAWYRANTGLRTHAVGEQAANPFGLFDMHGNVYEWVRDALPVEPPPQKYDAAVVDPFVPPAGSLMQIMRGGSWFGPADGCRSSGRHAFSPAMHDTSFGFRVMLPVDAVRALVDAKNDRTVPLIPLLKRERMGDGRWEDIAVNDDKTSVTFDGTAKKRQIWVDFAELSGVDMTIRAKVRVDRAVAGGYTKLALVNGKEPDRYILISDKSGQLAACIEDSTNGIVTDLTLWPGQADDFIEVAIIRRDGKLRLEVDGQPVGQTTFPSQTPFSVALNVAGWKCEFEQPEVIFHSPTIAR